MNDMFNRLQVRRDATVATLEDIVKKAEAEGRDLTEQELQERSDAKKDIADIDIRMASLVETFDMEASLAERVRKVGTVQSPADFSYRSAGDALWDILHQTDGEAKQRYAMALRAAEHMGTTAAATTTVAGDLGGLVVTPSVGAIVNPYPSGMPFLSYVGLQPIPSAAFTRPYIVDPDFEDGVDVQAKEKAELVSKKFMVSSEPLTPLTVGGYLNVSAQIIAMQPGSLGIIIGQMRRRLSWKLEATAIAEVAKTTGAVTLAADADAATTQKAVYDAAGKVITATQEGATFILMGPLGFAKLGGISDLAGRPMFPNIAPANAPGTSTANGFTSTVFGLRPIVTAAIKDDALYVGNGLGFEAWYYALPLMEAVEPSVLGRQVAVAAMIAPYRPKPMENSIIKLSHS